MLKKEEAVRQLREVGRYMMDHELAWGNAGNISARTGEDRYVISASGTFLGELGEDDLVECSFHGGATLPGARKPSKEQPMHRAVYEARPDIHAVLHASPFYSTLFACSAAQVPSDLFVETMYYLEKTARVAYHHPGSEALGEAVREMAREADILLLENHGVLVYDSSIPEARMALQTLEMACRMLLTAKGCGIPLTPLPGETVRDFLDNAGYKPKRKWTS
ncbi:class II aldolase/adducin family protein [Paenibacillus aurantius]|uniref:Class II aldolase/adducin family protein n=1 Tax=Paenibacillus aurantius TaxID=2918900 RepID=A0AA96L8M2_9BACL|nr:class II aldolase/adducin family protein [Paenibacillus aurantius]WNQ09099.1 class II aldolase/adducin family protein [Paenibacillus aurantius]